MRNSTINTIAPTGTISMIAGCSSGIEPLFALVYRKENILELGKTSLLEINKDFKEKTAEWLNGRTVKKDSTIQPVSRLTISSIMEEVSRTGSIQHLDGVPKTLKDLFRVSMEISYEWHIKMQAAWQKYVDSAVSKTINLPNTATVEDIKKAYLLAYETGCKGITVYRDGSREEQVLNVGGGQKVTSYKLQVTSSEKCPECGAEMELSDGCSLCRSCGYSKCSV
jgi:ribonucleoside-diphosphate reductase alpha chain